METMQMVGGGNPILGFSEADWRGEAMPALFVTFIFLWAGIAGGIWCMERSILDRLGAPEWESTPPNYITLWRARIMYLIVPILYFGIVILRDTKMLSLVFNDWLFVGLLTATVICALGDLVDGFLARTWGWSSQFGRVADHVADGPLVFTPILVAGLDNLLMGRWVIPLVVLPSLVTLTYFGAKVPKLRAQVASEPTPVIARAKQAMAALGAIALLASITATALERLGYREVAAHQLWIIVFTLDYCGLMFVLIAVYAAIKTAHKYEELVAKQARPN